MTEIKAEGVGTDLTKRGMAQMPKDGVIMDVVTTEQTEIAEDVGAVTVMVLGRVPADIRAEGGVARIGDPDLIDSTINAVSIPVTTKARIDHLVKTQALRSLGVDYIDESEILTLVDYGSRINKWDFTMLFMCGATNLGEAPRRTSEGAAMIRSKGETGTGDVPNVVAYMRTMTSEINHLASMRPDEIFHAAKELQVPHPLVKEVAETGKLPVVLFTAGGIATPAGAVLMVQLGAEGVFVGPGTFKPGDPAKRAAAIVRVTARFNGSELVAEVSWSLGEAMMGINVHDLPAVQYLENRGQ